MEKLLGVKNFLQKLFTRSQMKKFAALVTVGTILIGGGVFYLHQQKAAKKF